MRIATYNVEWFHRLFSEDGDLLEDDRWSSRHNVTRRRQLQALGQVFRAINADGVMIIEAPDSHSRRDGVKALENFAKRFGLRSSEAIMGFVNNTKQEIAFLYDPEVIDVTHDPRSSATAPRFDDVYRTRLEPDNRPTDVTWSKPPLELVAQVGQRRLRLIGVHAKSKAAHGASTPEEIMEISVTNRRKQLAQCQWLRARIEDHLGAGDDLIVMGDFNDGPGLDQYEALFGQSGIEQVIGAPGPQQMIEPHAQMALAQRIGVSPTTARFYLSHEKRFMQALLDYIMVSPSLADLCDWHIWHPFDDPHCWENEKLRDALLDASDHFPVTVDIDLN